MVVGTVHSMKQICSKQPGHAVPLKLQDVPAFLNKYSYITLSPTVLKLEALIFAR
jgi:hypothetical protein